MVPKRIVAIGASSCEGKVDIEGGGFVGRLRKWHESTDPHNDVFNLGIGGDTTRGMLERLAIEAKPRKPDVILIQNGANDFIREGSSAGDTRVPLHEFKENIKNLIVTAKSLAHVLFVSVYPIDESKTTPVSLRNIYYTLNDIKLNVEISREVCAEERVEFIDIYSKWIMEDYKTFLHTDGLHANSIGHELIFQEIQGKLKEMYR